MKISFQIDEKYIEPEIKICNHELDEQTRKLGELVSQAVNDVLTVYKENVVEKIPYESVIRFYSEKQRVYAQTKKGSYQVHARLYELEEQLQRKAFVRISNSEIVNVHQIGRLDTSIAGTIHMYLKDGIETYVSRRYVAKIKQSLGM